MTTYPFPGRPACSGASINAIDVTAYNAAAINVQVNGSLRMCAGQSRILSVPANAGQGFRWYKNGEALPDAITSNLEVYEAGDYAVKVLGANCDFTTNPVRVEVESLPTPPFLWLVQDTLYAIGHGQPRWFKDGVRLYGQIDSFIVITEPGSYRATFRLGNCDSDSSNLIYVRDNMDEAWEIRLFPNPSSGRFNVAYNSKSKVPLRVSVYDVFGKLVMQEDRDVNATQTSFDLELSGQKACIYLVEVSQGEQAWHQRLFLHP